jgi:hypothetical protein
MWEVWLEVGGQYQLITELPTKPVGDELDLILAEATPGGDSSVNPTVQRPKKGVLSGLQSFIRALSR